jgi:hypothetical protein
MKVMSKGLKVFAVAWGKTRRWLKKKSWLSFLVATVLLLFLIHFYIALFVPPTNEKVWKEVQVTEGMSFKAIAGELKKEAHPLPWILRDQPVVGISRRCVWVSG